MKKSNLVPSLLGIIFLSGLLFSCSRSAPTETIASTPSSTRIPSSTPVPTNTPSPTPTITPTVTPFAGLDLETPHLVYLRADGDKPEFVFLDIEDLSMDIVALPDQPWPRIRQFSPNGKWLAYYSSSSQDENEYWEDRPNLSINIMDLETTEIVHSIQIKPDDSLERFEDAAGALGESDISAYDLQSAFDLGIFSMDWSPDSRYLAFAAQIDGLSSDVYLYDTVVDSVQRITSGDQQVLTIDWSPTGKWIINSSMLAYNAPESESVSYATDPFTGDTYTIVSGRKYWMNEDTYIYQTGLHVWGFGIVDIPRGSFNQITLFYGAEDYCADPETGYVLMDGSFDGLFMNPENEGLFLMNMVTGSIQKLDESSYDTQIYCALWGKNRFLVRKGPDTFFVTTLGEKEEFPISFYDAISFSPDGKYIFAFDDAIKLYDTDYQLIFENKYKPSRILNVFWLPNGKGVFYVAYSEPDIRLYYIDIENKSMDFIDVIDSSLLYLIPQNGSGE